MTDKPTAQTPPVVEPQEIVLPKIKAHDKLPDINALKARAAEIIKDLKKKYASRAEHAALENCAAYALRVWTKACEENPRTGDMQLDSSTGMSSIERYFVSRLPEKTAQ